MRFRIESMDEIDRAYGLAWVHNSLLSEGYVPEIPESEIRRGQFIDQNPDLSEQRKQDILNGRIRIGMSREEVRASWGAPNDINRTVTANNVSEQWVYGSIRNRRYAYFDNGLLTAIQD